MRQMIPSERFKAIDEGLKNAYVDIEQYTVEVEFAQGFTKYGDSNIYMHVIDLPQGITSDDVVIATITSDATSAGDNDIIATSEFLKNGGFMDTTRKDDTTALYVYSIGDPTVYLTDYQTFMNVQITIFYKSRL